MSSQSSRRFFRYLKHSYKPRYKTNKTKHQRASQPGRSIVDETCKKPVGFLDLPLELRNHIYDLIRPSQCPALKAVIFTPQLFIDTFPQSVSLYAPIWSCHEYAKLNRLAHIHGMVCEDSDCGKGADQFLKLTHVNRQVRDEVNNLLYRRYADINSGPYHFEDLWTNSCYSCGSEELVLKLNAVERYAIEDLTTKGFPFAVLRREMWISGYPWCKHELLVPYWGGNGVSWRRFRDFGRQHGEVEAKELTPIDQHFMYYALRTEERIFGGCTLVKWSERTQLSSA